MNDVKMPRFVPPDARQGHSLRDFQRGMQTKNVVKGAGGGARGVDFQDAEGEFLDREKAATGKPGASGVGEDGRPPPDAVQAIVAQQQALDASQVVLYDVVQPQRDKVETPLELKDEPRKKKLLGGEQKTDDEELPSDEELEELFLGDPGDDAERAHVLDIIARLLADPERERRAFGAVALQDPETIKKVLGSPIRVAKHMLVLGNNLQKRGVPRDDLLHRMGEIFVGLGQDFGRRAFKEFSKDIGIGTVYPLEVREKILLINDDFLASIKCRFTSSKRMLTGKIKETIVVEYPEDMVITEFGVKGGGKPGYQLVPMKEKGKHGLRFFTPGEFRVLIMGVDAMGFERMEEIRLTITGELPRAVAAPTAPAVKPNFRFKFNKTPPG